MKFEFPHPLAILLFFIATAALLTHIIPAGEYERILDPNTGREVVVPNSYQPVDATPIGIAETVVKVPEGLIYGADVVILILIIGGAFVVVDKTGAFNEALASLIHRYQHTQARVLVLVGIIFVIAGALDNTQEEIIAMIPFLVLMAARIGYSKIAAVAISAGSAAIGAAFSPINPFAVLIAQNIAEIELFSGSIFRIIVLIIASAFWIRWVIRYGKSTLKVAPLEDTAPAKVSIPSKIILLLIVLTFSVMVYGILEWDWGYNQMSAIFLVMGLASGLIGKLGINGTSRAYAQGFQEMAFAAVVVGLARSVFLILEEGKIIDTIVYALFTPIEHLPLAFSAIGMTISQAIIHIPVPSNSGQAVLTTPILTPLSDLIGMSRQVMVLCYQYGGAMMDMMSPTNGALLAMLTAANISYKDWISFCWKPYLLVVGIGLVAIFLAIFIGL